MLEGVVFVCGAVVMIYEIVGSRIVAPFLGSSLITWTSIIGVILASLSMGYYFGGRVADKRADYKVFSLIILSSAAFILVSLVINQKFLIFIRSQNFSLQWSSLMASIILFAPASIGLGMVSPYAVKLKLTDLKNAGTEIGRLYALSTLGSIVGTFFAGFYLIPFLGTLRILFLLCVTLFLLAFVLMCRSRFKISSFMIWVFAVLGLSLSYNALTQSPKGLIDVDTKYSRALIYNYKDKKTGKPVKAMQLGAVGNSAMFLDSDDLVMNYTKFYDLAEHFNPGVKKALMIGGAAYSYPKYFLNKYPEATIDVVEIDEGVTKLARKYFRLKEDPRLNIFHLDGRFFLNQTDRKYDVVLVDAFSSFYSIPHQLTTIEAVQKEYDILTDNGLVIVNIVSALKGERSLFLQTEYQTYSKVFSQVYLIPVDTRESEQIQNISLIALKTEDKPAWQSDDVVLNSYLRNKVDYRVEIDKDKLLTDDWAPVDYFISKLTKKYN